MTLLLKIWIVFWPCDYCYFFPLVMVVICLVFCSLPNFIFHLKLPCITIYKHILPWIKYPCSTRDLGPSHPSFLHLLLIDSCPQVPVCQEYHNSGQNIGVSASTSVLPMNIQDWFPSGWTGCVSLQSKGLSRVFSNTTVQKHQFFSTQPSSQYNSHIHTWPLEKP